MIQFTLLDFFPEHTSLCCSFTYNRRHRLYVALLRISTYSFVCDAKPTLKFWHVSTGHKSQKTKMAQQRIHCKQTIKSQKKCKTSGIIRYIRDNWGNQAAWMLHRQEGGFMRSFVNCSVSLERSREEKRHGVEVALLLWIRFIARSLQIVSLLSRLVTELH